MRRKKIFCILIAVMFFGMNIASAWACSIAGATGSATVDGRPVIWKNRDSWGSENCWKTFAYYHKTSNNEFDKFNYVGVTDADTKVYYSDPKKVKEQEKERTNEPIDLTPITEPIHPYKYYPWAGANEKGLGLVQTSAHTLSRDFQQEQGFTPDQDPNGIDNKTLNHMILCSCETVDEVEQLLRDTNNGWYDGSTARNTNSIIMVFDKYGNMATFEVSGADFTRDNVSEEYTPQNFPGYSYPIYPAVHEDDKDLENPSDGEYNGYDWRTNFARVDYERDDGFKYFVDEHRTYVEDNQVVNGEQGQDGIDDREYSTSTVKRWGRIGIRMDDPHDKDYRYFIQKEVGAYGIGQIYDIETLARSIGDLPYTNENGEAQKATGWHLSRFCTTFSVVITGSKASDSDDGKLITMWLAQGEPSHTIFIPIFPFAGEPPEILNDMYLYSNEKRHLLYDYQDTDGDGDDNECTGYTEERNADHSINLALLTGNGYYGQGGIQRPIFLTENWAYNKYNQKMFNIRYQLDNNFITDDELRQNLKEWQENIAQTMKTHYINGTYPNEALTDETSK
ncbi:C45 family peptidase [Paramaledivibacter caminithermalis]|jgi:hypothetical protein|uniref:Uncharacterized protein n=1 Tax=Paramaledivibacter caminithermalis (strain DSM 15212 / CIP 107654 / DViRD3) TaxID=1121301 RepID=A0A1M6LQL8_PARC5|nr:hypothetical protein [Paramaledivibacter caminithermalis]SHJ73476.1 hypothetical protein SAMN02745912_00899 [Paramaledivibacter caminithermalis DSM 15212]